MRCYIIIMENITCKAKYSKERGNEMIIDFTDSPIDLTANYGGSDQKRGIIYNGERYMIKMPDRITEEKRNGLNSSYSNSVFSEHICCEILKNLGFDVQETLLGYVVQSNGEEKPVVACKNFVPEGYSLVDFRAIEDALLIDKKAGRIPRIGDIYEILGSPNAYFSKEMCELAMERYWDTFILDAMLGNFDRHANNWAYLIKNDGTDITFAPIYDCGSCLYPKIADDAIPQILSSQEEIIKRVEKFPTAALELENKMKASYKDYINSLNNPDCTAALMRIYPKLNMDIINNTINNTPYITDTRKMFYSTMIRARIEIILEPAYEKAYALHNLDNQQKKKQKQFEYGD